MDSSNLAFGVHIYIVWGYWRRPYKLYCVGADIKPCSINQSISFRV